MVDTSQRTLQVPVGDGAGELTPDRSGAAHHAPFEAQTELDLANNIFSREKFGEVEGTRYWPFSEQLKKNIQEHFTDDLEQFKRNNRVQFRIFAEYIFFRTLTLITYAAWFSVLARVVVMGAEKGEFRINVSAVLGSWAAFIDDSALWLESLVSFALTPKNPVAAYSAAALAISLLILFIARTILRRIYFYDVNRGFSQWASELITYHGDIINRIQYCCAKIHVRPEHVDKSEVPTLAKNWTKVALYNVKRLEYVDRHSTTALWKIHRNLTEIETFFFALKVLVAAAVIALIWFPGAVIPSAVHAAAFGKWTYTGLAFVAIIVFWGPFVFRQSNALWTDKFVELFNRPHIQKVHYFEQFSSAVSAIVANWIAQDRQ